MENFFKKSAQGYLKRYVALSNDDFVINDEKNGKMKQIVKYCEDVTKSKIGSAIEYCNVVPKNKQGEIAVRFTNDFILEFASGEIEAFANAVMLADGINVRGTGLDDGSFIISFFVDDLYVAKTK